MKLTLLKIEQGQFVFASMRETSKPEKVKSRITNLHSLFLEESLLQ